jgi:hypothetical protein
MITDPGKRKNDPVLKHQVMKKYEVWIYGFIHSSSLLQTGKWPASRSSTFTSR